MSTKIRPLQVLKDATGAGGEASKVSFSGGTSVQEWGETNTGSGLFDELQVEYIRGSDYGGGIGGLLYSLRSGTPSFKHYNSRGDVVAATDASGSLTYQAAYEAFGKHGDTPTSEEWGTNPDPQQANTKDEDPTGLLNEGFRYRDLETGTFITRDPLGFVDGPNVYTYVTQNPWTKFDPLGLFEIYGHLGGEVGHVGVVTNYNGADRTYDFGRYAGTYKNNSGLLSRMGAGRGPGIMKRTEGRPIAESAYADSFFSVDIPASQKLDNMVSQHFRDLYDSGSSTIPEKIKDNMTGSGMLDSNERYMGYDWSPFGSQCCTFTDQELQKALNKIINDPNLPDALREEARDALDEVKKYSGSNPAAVQQKVENSARSTFEKNSAPSSDTTEVEKEVIEEEVEDEEKNEPKRYAKRVFLASFELFKFRINGGVVFLFFLCAVLVSNIEWSNSAKASDSGYGSQLATPRNLQYRLLDDLLIYDEVGNLCGILKAGTILNSPHAWDVPDTDIGDNTRLKLLVDLRMHGREQVIQLEDLTGVHPYDAARSSDVISSFKLILKQETEQVGPG